MDTIKTPKQFGFTVYSCGKGVPIHLLSLPQSLL